MDAPDGWEELPKYGALRKWYKVFGGLVFSVTSVREGEYTPDGINGDDEVFDREERVSLPSLAAAEEWFQAAVGRWLKR